MGRRRGSGSENDNTRGRRKPNGSSMQTPGGEGHLASLLLAGMREGAFLAGPEGDVRSFNPAAEVITGRGAGEVLGGSYLRALGCDDREERGAPTSPAGVWTERTCRGTRADGSPLVLCLRTRWVGDRAGRPAGQLGLFSEVSLQDTLQRKLVAHERMASLGELASSLVHEIGNPLGVILGFARLLVEEEGRDPGGEFRERIYAEAQRCREIVGQFLDYARSSRTLARPTPLNLGDLVRETLSLLSYRMKRQRIVWEVEWEPDTPLVEADPGEMKQVFLNLLLNAVEAMGEGGTVRISGRRVERETLVGGDSLLSPRPAVLRRAGAEVRVEDEGPGLGSLDPERLFEPFFTTKDKGGGLGLPVCRRILGEWGGEIRLENRPGGGACATIRLPGWGGVEP